jgi:protein BCP1
MTVLNLSHHKDKPTIQDLTNYLTTQSPKSNLPQLPSLLSSPSTSIALIISERVINMPHAIVPPLYNFLHSEITAAAQTSPAHKFTHYVLLSKTYTEVASQLDVEPEQGSSKKAKKAAAAAAANPEVFYFHPEDEALHRHALAFGNYDYVKQGDEGASDAKRAFQEMGIRPQGHLILIEAGKFEAATKAVAEYLGGAE